MTTVSTTLSTTVTGFSTITVSTTITVWPSTSFSTMTVSITVSTCFTDSLTTTVSTIFSIWVTCFSTTTVSTTLSVTVSVPQAIATAKDAPIIKGTSSQNRFKLRNVMPTSCWVPMKKARHANLRRADRQDLIGPLQRPFYNNGLNVSINVTNYAA